MNARDAGPVPRSPAELRRRIREQAFDRSTAGLAPGFFQANLMILPAEAAPDFLLFCRRNPKPCPLVEVLPAGTFEPRSAPGSDIRTDLSRYRLWRDGVLADEVRDLMQLWRGDFITFLIGCSFSFEAALLAAGIGLRHIDRGCNVPMFRTTRPCVAAGRFAGPLVVSMRPLRAERVAQAVEISARMPHAHGSPVHIGDPAALGIADLACPDYGDAVPVHDDEVPVFWACGVTPQAVALASRTSLALTHAPGHMFITNLRNEEAGRYAQGADL